MSKINKQAQSGFTLIELAIVLVIIGLIIGGILKGQELIENARVKNVMAQVNSYQAATVAFEDKYGALPGDLGTAEDYIPNCVAGNSCLIAETQNGQIGGDAGDNYVAAVNTALSENIAYWVQLALSRFIGGIEVSATGGSDIYGSRFPSAATGGGFQVIYQPDTGRHLVRLASVTGAVTMPPGPCGPIRRCNWTRGWMMASRSPARYFPTPPFPPPLVTPPPQARPIWRRI